jgi:hypothetical protein
VSPNDRDPGNDASANAVIDFVLSSPEGNEYVLVLVEDRPWSQPGVIDHLTDRVNRCVGYVVDGDLALNFPETVGRDIRIHVDHREPVDTDVEALFLRFTEALAQRGIEFSTQEQGAAETEAADTETDG